MMDWTTLITVLIFTHIPTPSSTTLTEIQRGQRTQHVQTRIQNISPIHVHRPPQLENYHRLCIWK
jgi:hypothetical protein